MKELMINGVEVLLRDYEIGKGKIYVSAGSDRSYSYYWGAMGGKLSDFLQKIDPGYFAMKLCPGGNSSVFSGRLTAKSLREQVKQILPWYEHMEFQKSVRAAIKQVEGFESHHEFIGWLGWYMDRLDFHLIEDRIDRQMMESEFKNSFGVWNIQSDYSNEYKWLERLLPKIKKHLRKLN